jgi:hypothetical protein
LDVALFRRWLRTRSGAAALLLAAVMGFVFAVQIGFDSLNAVALNTGR